MSLFTSTELVSMGRHIPTPFSIEIESEQGALQLKVDSLLRIVPGRRLVGLTTWQDQTVVVKLFINSNRWKRTMLRDINGINTLRQARIPTPNLLLQTNTLDNKAGALLIEYLHQGSSLAALLEEAATDEARAEVLEMGVKTLAACHKAGLWQEDMHLGNFMLAADVVYVLDGGDIKSRDKPLDDETRLRNFARFLAQFPVEQDESWPLLVELYRLDAPDLEEGSTAALGQMIVEARRKRLASFQRKLNRSTSASRSESKLNSFYVYDRSIHSAELERFLGDPDSFIATGQLLKAGNSSTVAVVRIDERSFVLKRYNIKSFWHGVSRAFRPSRAHNSWRSASLLEMLGVATAHPYLYLEERFLWFFRRRAYFLCELIEGSDLAAAWQKGESASDASEVLSQFRELFKVFSDYRISHGDMKATNFLFTDGRLHVLDLDAMKRGGSRSNFAERYNKDLKRFKQNWVGTPLETEVDELLVEAAEY